MFLSTDFIKHLHETFSWRCWWCSPKIPSAIKVPNKRDLLYNIAHQRNRKMQGSFACICFFNRLAEVIFLYDNFIINQYFYYWLFLFFLIKKKYIALRRWNLLSLLRCLFPMKRNWSVLSSKAYTIQAWFRNDSYKVT